LTQHRIKPKTIERNTTPDDVDLVWPITVKVEDFFLHHFRVHYHPVGKAFAKQRFLKPQDFFVFAFETASKPLHRLVKLPPALEPGAMNAVAGTVNIATPNTFEAHQDIATNFRTVLLDFLGKTDGRFCVERSDLTERPLVRRPICRCEKLGFVAEIDNSQSQALQVRLCATA
jgi:hypothetical protein